MRSAVAPSRSTRKRRTPGDGWWGHGLAPQARWPGATIEIPATWVAQRDRWESPDGRYFFDAEEADRACDFFPTYLKHHIGAFAGLPFMLLAYQRDLLTRPIFGWKRTRDGLRRFRKVFAFLPKGAGKSPWGSGTALYLTLCDGEAAAEIYCVATDKTQARIVHTNAKIMVEDSPDLLERCDVLRDSIFSAETRSSLQVVSSDAGTKHGFRPHAVIFDEMHAQPNRDLYEAFKRSMVKRRQPLMVILTHAGDDDEGICYEEYEYAKGVLSGTNPDEACLPVIFEATPDDDWTDPEIWKRVNPGHSVTVQHDGIAGECVEAMAEPRKRNDFLRFHLNRWVSQATAWIPVEWWDACRGDLNEPLLRTLPCGGGLDLAQKWDLACFSVVFREILEASAPQPVEIVTEDGTSTIERHVDLNYRLFIVPFFWIPENTMRQHEKDDGVPYRLWAEQGLVTPTEGDTIDYTKIYRDITEKILPRFPLLRQGLIGYDPAFATDLATKLKELAGLQMVEVLQNYRMFSEPCQIFEALVKAGRVTHNGHRLLRWNIENVAIKRDDAGRIRPVKGKKPAKRIDGVTASLMGVQVLTLMPSEDEPSDAAKDLAERGLFLS